MNKQRRKAISDVTVLTEEIKSKIEDILFEEQDYYDNIPENLLASEMAEQSEEAIDMLQDAIDSLDEIIENIRGI